MLEFIASQHHGQHPRARGCLDPGDGVRGAEPSAGRPGAGRGRSEGPHHRRGEAPISHVAIVSTPPPTSGSASTTCKAAAAPMFSSTARQIAMYLCRELTDLPAFRRSNSCSAAAIHTTRHARRPQDPPAPQRAALGVQPGHGADQPHPPVSRSPLSGVHLSSDASGTLRPVSGPSRLLNLDASALESPCSQLSTDSVGNPPRPVDNEGVGVRHQRVRSSPCHFRFSTGCSDAGSAGRQRPTRVVHSVHSSEDQEEWRDISSLRSRSGARVWTQHRSAGWI